MMRWRDFPLGAFPPTDTVSTGDEPHILHIFTFYFFIFGSFCAGWGRFRGLSRPRNRPDYVVLIAAAWFGFVASSYHRVWPRDFYRFSQSVARFTGFYWVLPSFTKFYWVKHTFNIGYWVLLRFSG